MVSTHDIAHVHGLIRKRYRSTARGECQTEWDTLVAAHAHTVDRVPEPISTEPDPPSVTMTRLPGEPDRPPSATPQAPSTIRRTGCSPC